LLVAAAAAAAGGASSQGGPSLLKQRLLGFIQAHYLPLALLAALLLGATCPSLGVAAAGLQIPMFTTFGIFVVQVRSAKQRLLTCQACSVVFQVVIAAAAGKLLKQTAAGGIAAVVMQGLQLRRKEAAVALSATGTPATVNC
jgi:hypothetical protein